MENATPGLWFTWMLMHVPRHPGVDLLRWTFWLFFSQHILGGPVIPNLGECLDAWGLENKVRRKDIEVLFLVRIWAKYMFFRLGRICWQMYAKVQSLEIRCINPVSFDLFNLGGFFLHQKKLHLFWRAKVGGWWHLCLTGGFNQHLWKI